jgi:peptidyl-prolyl cis-trans isomerase SurA
MRTRKSLFFFVTTVILSTQALAATRQLADRLEASVNATPILRSELEGFRRTLPLRAQLDPLFAGSALAERGASASDADITQALIQDRLILSAFPVGDSEVEQEVQSIQASNRIDRGRLKAALAQQGFTFDDYFELIRISTAKRNLIDRDIRTRVAVSDDDVRNHYLANLPKGAAPARAFHAKAIVLSRESYKTSAAMKAAAERAAAALKSGDSFEEVVARYSDDSSKDAGGDLGTLSEEQLSPDIRSALAGLKPGDTSAVVGNPKSRLMILKLLSVEAAEDSRFLRLKEEIRNQLAASEYQHQIQLWLARQEQQAFVHRAATLGK